MAIVWGTNVTVRGMTWYWVAAVGVAIAKVSCWAVGGGSRPAQPLNWLRLVPEPGPQHRHGSSSYSRLFR